MSKKILFLIVIILITISIFISYYYIYYIKGNEIAAINLYKDLINNSIDMNISNNNYNYIEFDKSSLFDPLTGKQLSTNSKNEILTYLKKYNDNARLANINKIPYNADGIAITLNTYKRSKRKIDITVNCYIPNSGVTSQKYKCTYTKNKWDLVSGLSGITATP